ncbi:MAG: CSLREA domain-containing protein [Anaerolineales bacterium]
MKSRITLLAGLAALLPLLVLLLTTANPANASATITVTTNQDVINGNDSLCSLREAVIAANTDAASGSAAGECMAGNGADTILLLSGTYALAIAGINENASRSGDLDLASPVTITGAGPLTCLVF